LNIGFQNITIYRTNYWFIVIFESLISIASIVLIEVIYGSIEEIVGWSKYELYALYGTFNIQGQLGSAFYVTGVDSFNEKVISGSLDLTIIKPMDTQFLSIFTSTALNKLFPMVFSIYMVAYGLVNLDIVFNIYNAAMYIVLVIIGIMMQINLVSCNLALTFWFLKTSTFLSMISIVQNYAQQPKEIFGPVLSLIFTFVVPIILITNPAVSVLIKKNNFELIFLSVLMLFVTFIISKILWKLGLLKYQSASS
jgi:ABC-2 type transport system permease protein